MSTSELTRLAMASPNHRPRSRAPPVLERVDQVSCHADVVKKCLGFPGAFDVHWPSSQQGHHTTVTRRPATRATTCTSSVVPHAAPPYGRAGTRNSSTTGSPRELVNRLTGYTPPIGPPSQGSHSSRLSVPVVARLVWARHSDPDVVGLVVGQSGELHTELLEV